MWLAIRKFFGEYFLIALIGFILGLALICIVPTKLLDRMPFGEKNIYWLLVLFLIIYITFVYYADKSYKKKKSIKQEKDRLQRLWDMVDAYSEEDRKIGRAHV